MLRSSLCDYSYAYILVKETISIPAEAGDNPNNANKKVVFNNCTPFTDYISAIANFHATDKSASFKFKQTITGVTDDDGTKNFEIVFIVQRGGIDFPEI